MSELSKPSKTKGKRKILKPLIIFVAVPLALIYCCFLLGLLNTFFIPTSAMAPNLPSGSYVLAEKPSLWLSQPKRGEIITFSTKGINKLTRQKNVGPQMYVKRLIGLPGDKIEIRETSLYINEQLFEIKSKVDSSILNYYPMGELGKGKTYTVPDDHYFMMGDNSQYSLDSRMFGPVPEKNVKHRYRFTVFHNKKYEKKRQEKLDKQRRESGFSRP